MANFRENSFLFTKNKKFIFEININCHLNFNEKGNVSTLTLNYKYVNLEFIENPITKIILNMKRLFKMNISQHMEKMLR